MVITLLQHIAEMSTDAKLLSPFYRAMHFSAKRGIAITCRLSVSPSVRLSASLSVCNVGGL